MRSLKDKVVVIAGATGGIGTVLVDSFLEAGAYVAAIGRRGTLPERMRMLSIKANLTEEIHARMAANTIVSSLGSIDVLVNAVGIVRNDKAENMVLEDFRAVMDTNVTSTFLMSRAVLPQMRKQKSGNIVNIGSVVGDLGGRGCINYAASKAALVGLTKALQNESIADGILVNLLTLGYMDVGMGSALPDKVSDAVKRSIPLGRFGTGQELADAVLFLSTTTYMAGGELRFAGGL